MDHRENQACEERPELQSQTLLSEYGQLINRLECATTRLAVELSTVLYQPNKISKEATLGGGERDMPAQVEPAYESELLGNINHNNNGLMHMINELEKLTGRIRL